MTITVLIREGEGGLFFAEIPGVPSFSAAHMSEDALVEMLPKALVAWFHAQAGDPLIREGKAGLFFAEIPTVPSFSAAHTSADALVEMLPTTLAAWFQARAGAPRPSSRFKSKPRGSGRKANRGGLKASVPFVFCRPDDVEHAQRASL